MDIEDIKNKALMELVMLVEKNKASAVCPETIGADLEDALNESSNDEELINNWQSKLMDLYNECQHFWGELEKMKSGKAESIHTGGIKCMPPLPPRYMHLLQSIHTGDINCIRNPHIKCTQKVITASPEYAEHPACMLGLKCDVRGL
jgi:hypothetical protein